MEPRVVVPQAPRSFLAVLATVVLALSACDRDSPLTPDEPAEVTDPGGRPPSFARNTAPNLKVAFIGDQGVGSDAVAVLQLIRDEGADMVLHQGDFDYRDDPTRWDDQITSVLGADFPYFASVGNHDVAAFYGAGGYQEKLAQRLARVPEATCSGELAVNSACEYQGLFFILSGVGTLGSGHEDYIRQQLAADNSTWRICSWHKNQNAMQLGHKGNEVGWGPYEACRELGAIIATAHEHSYHRTKTLVSTELQTVNPAWPDPGVLRVAPGATFVFVSGMAGNGIRDQERCLPDTYPYGCNGEWASVYTSNQNAQYGALFIEFHVDGDPNRARGYFKGIDGAVVDQFTVWSQMSTGGATLNVPGDFSSIQEAHDAASSGDTILVAPGTYVGQITITNAITLASHYLTTGDESYIGNTILDGGGADFVITIPPGIQHRPTVQGFTIQNGVDGISPYAMFNLLNCLVRDNRDGVDYEDGSGGLVQFCTFESNGDDGIDLDDSVDIVIQDNVIRDNGDDGIEIRLQDYSGPILNIIVRRNEIHGNGEDGIQLIHYDVLTDRFFEITHNHVYDNVDAGIGLMDGGRTTEDFRAASIPERINIFNNTFANNSHGITGGDNTVVLNNIFVGHSVIAVKNVDANSELAYNLFFNNGTDNSGSNVDVGSSVYADPLLTADLELAPGSPAIDAGTAHYVWQEETVLDLPPGAYSGGAPDIGAFESPTPGGPIVDFTWTEGPFLTVYFTDASTDPDGTLTAWSWDFGDGNGSIAQNPVHTYAAAADYTVTLTVTDNDGLTNTKISSVGVGPMVEVRVAASNDDAEEKTSGSMRLTSSDLELVFDGSDQTVGMRFNDVTIPPAAIISNAHIQFTADETQSDATSLTIQGEATGNAVTFSTSSGNISSRSRTASSVSWSPVPWTTKGAAGIDQRTPDIASIIQEIVNGPWSSGNSLVIIITGTGHRTADSFDGDASAAPLLHVEYMVGSNTAPTASFTHSCTDLDCSFTDTSTDDDGTVVGWDWAFGDGNTSTSQDPSHSYAAAGDYTVTMTVTDNEGATSTTSQTVSPTAQNQAPTAGFTHSCTDLDCSFTDTSTDPDGSVVGWSWDFGDGNSSTQQNPSSSYAAAGDYAVTLTVTDNEGATGTTSQTVSPTVQNQAPTADFTHSCTDLDCSFTDTSTDDDGTVVWWDWAFGDGGTSTEQNPSHTYAAGGDYTVTLTVTDNDGATSEAATQTVTVTEPPSTNQAPTANFTYSCTDLDCSFTDTSTDPDGTVVAWSWDFGDSGTSTEQNPSHSYAAAGDYRVTLTVTDNDGATGTFTDNVAASDPLAGVTVSSIEPNTMAAGSSIDVAIYGSGFVSGATLAFENGSGPAPSASNVVVAEDGNSITATLQIKSGGPKRDRPWDVRVSNPDGSSGVLVGGLTVTKQ